MNLSTVKEGILRCMTGIGAHKLAALHYSGKGAILTFHRITQKTQTYPRVCANSMELSAEYFEQLIVFIKTRYDIIPIEQLADRLKSPSNRNFICLTFDDGYLDNYTQAFPILVKYRVPFTLYLCTGLPDHQARYYPVAIEDLVLRNSEIDFKISGHRHLFRSETFYEKVQAYESIIHMLYTFQDLDIIAEADVNIFYNHGIELSDYANKLSMSWEHVVEMSRHELTTIGAHGCKHLPLGMLSKEEMIDDIRKSKNTIEEKINLPVKHFSFPFGHPGAAGIREFNALKNLNFSTGVTTQEGNLFKIHASHLHCLPRIDTGKTRENLAYIKGALSGLNRTLKGQGKKILPEFIAH